MKLMTSREFRRKLGQVLAGDETVVVTSRGKRVAVVVPLESEFGARVDRLVRPRGLMAFSGILSGANGQAWSEEVDKVVHGPLAEEVAAHADEAS